MNTHWNKSTERRSLQLISLLAAVIHFVLLLSFAYLHITLMVCMNIASVMCYLACALFINRERIKACIYAAFAEILLHTILAVLSVGTDFGFQLYFINCIAITFFADYFSVHVGNHSIRSLILSILYSILYIVFLIAARSYQPIYTIDADIAFIGTILNSTLTLALLVLFFHLLTRMATLYEKELMRQAIYDNLTGLANRHHLIKNMNDIFTSGDVEGYWLAILDIDDFKAINDRYGHLCGDFVLKRVAAILESFCSGCTVCRWGGEEFMIVGRSGAGGYDADSLLENIRNSIETEDFVYGDSAMVKLTVTIGKADYRSGQTMNEWLNVADDRLYAGKQAGKNRVVNC